MENPNPSQEQQRLTELYRTKSEEELLNLAGQFSDLTGIAQQVLERELSNRGLSLPKAAPEETTSWHEEVRLPDDESPYAGDRELVPFTTVWSRRDAFQLKGILDSARIPFALGKEKASRVEQVISDFSDGVDVHTMKIAVPTAQQAMKLYSPADEPAPEEESDIANRCPKCQSEQIFFGDLSEEPDSQDSKTDNLEWTCDSCGHHWKDDATPISRT